MKQSFTTNELIAQLYDASKKIAEPIRRDLQTLCYAKGHIDAFKRNFNFILDEPTFANYVSLYFLTHKGPTRTYSLACSKAHSRMQKLMGNYDE